MRLPENIETERLRLRPYENGDKAFCISMWCDGENGKYMADPLIENLDESYLACFDGMEDDPDGYYLIAEFKSTREPVGTFCMFPENGNYDIGYCIHRAHWREGLGSEMLGGAIRWILAHDGRSVSCEVADDNAASLALLRKFGFTEGKKTRYKKRNEDRYFDGHMHGLELTPPRESPMDDSVDERDYRLHLVRGRPET
jgi:RimJ/RimL family protein N-acetyltransferase